MQSSEKLRARLAKADAAADRAAETAGLAHRDMPGTGVESEALDELVTALAERQMLQHHLDVALAHEAGLEPGGSTTVGGVVTG